MKTYKLCECGFYWDAKEEGLPICRKELRAMCMPIFEGTLKQIKERVK